MIYEPAEDSFLLKKYIKKYAHGRVLDMGTGSGIFALEAKKFCKNVVAVDVNEEAVKLTRSKGVNAYLSDLFSNVDGKFNLIMFNPPYLPLERDYCGIKFSVEDFNYINDVALVGGKHGHETLERFFKRVRKYLDVDGKVLLAVSSITPKVEEIITSNGFKFKLLESKRVFFEELKVYLCW
jgi:release factor glutamine methyltransferase